MTKDEFHQWKNEVTTKEIFNVVQGKIKQLEFTLAREAGIDGQSDRYKAGILKGMELILEIDWEDEEA